MLVDVAGVGYAVDAPMSTFYQLPALEQPVTLHVHTVVREDAFLLYGFATKAERSMFCKLIAVNGIGPRLGLTVLSGMAVAELADAIASENVDMLIRLPGIGRKTAERILLDLKDKMGEFSVPAAAGRSGVSASSVFDEAVGALEALGYKSAEAQRVVRKVDGEHQDSESLIRAALKGLMKA